MKYIVMLVLGFALSLSAFSQKLNADYDSVLARKLGADDYGMKNYVLVILKTGSNKLEAGARRDSLFRGHMENINRLAEEGKLVLAGPLGQNDRSYRGIFILNVRKVEDARILLDTDPTVREKIFEAELYEWYGSAALGEYLDADRKAGRYKF
jgi:uncharacterized protein YciI